MKATLEFTLPEESSEHMNAVQGTAWKSLVWDFDQWLRGRVKYGEPDDKTAGFEAARECLHRTLQDEGLTLD